MCSSSAWQSVRASQIFAFLENRPWLHKIPWINLHIFKFNHGCCSYRTASVNSWGRSRSLSIRCDFCPLLEEFNDRILCPELSDSQKMMLHEELRKIYETYCLDESIDKIRFDPFIVEEIRNSTRQPFSPPYCLLCACWKRGWFLFDFPVAEGPYPQVVKLQTMRCLFEAYEHVLSLLENVFTPMFCHSDEVSSSLLDISLENDLLKRSRITVSCHQYQTCCRFRTNRFPPTALSPLCTCVCSLCSCCVWIHLFCAFAVLPPASQRGRVPCQELQDEQVGFMLNKSCAVCMEALLFHAGARLLIM